MSETGKIPKAVRAATTAAYLAGRARRSTCRPDARAASTSLHMMHT